MSDSREASVAAVESWEEGSQARCDGGRTAVAGPQGGTGGARRGGVCAEAGQALSHDVKGGSR